MEHKKCERCGVGRRILCADSEAGVETEASMCGAGALVQDSNIAMSAALSIKLYKIF